jgi:guanyl-specific ribonuclease Sa
VAGSQSASGSTAAAVTPTSSAPSVWQQATDYVRESAPVQTALGVAYGTLQSLAPGGFIMPSPWAESQAFEAGRGIGQVATGITQVVTGAGMMGGGGTAAAAGGAAAPATGGTTLVVSAAGVAVAVEGAVVAGMGVTNVAAGLDTLTNAVSMSGNSSGSGPAAGTPPTPAAQPVPPKAQGVLSQVKANNGQPPPGYKGGGQFMNDGRSGGQTLPKANASGKPITYKEYDVNPYQPGVNRGAERLVVGSDGKAYYTTDHYKTFTAIP